MQVNFLAELPLDPQVRIGGDSGRPIVLREGEGQPFLDLARATVERTTEAAKQQGPTVDVSD